jgi:hypothetical protein
MSQIVESEKHHALIEVEFFTLEDPLFYESGDLMS